MFSHVILRATAGALKGRAFVLEDPGEYTLGRAGDCSVQVPDGLSLISRHHCRLVVEAPSVHVQDLGSLNGTYVNGDLIGQRPKGQAVADAMPAEHPERDLSDGDELRIGPTALLVELIPHLPCAEAEPRDQEKLWSSEEVLC